MGLETATYISQLTPTNPVATDKKNVGDDHLRLIKATLQATFPNASRAYRIPEVSIKIVDYAIDLTDENKSIIGAPPGATPLIFTLPSPTTAGWSVNILKDIGNTTPIYVVPASGNIRTPLGNVSKIRINAPFVSHCFYWFGSSFGRISAPGELKPGAFEAYGGAAAPNGYAFATGQSLVVADHPELFLAWGYSHGGAGANFSAPDLRDRFVVGAGSTYALGAVGGDATHTLTEAEMPTHSHPVTDPQHNHGDGAAPNKNGLENAGGGNFQPVVGGLNGNIWFGASGNTGNAATGISTQNTGGGGAHNNLPPYKGLNYMFRLC